MPRITFNWSPDYHSDDKKDVDVEYMDASVDYSVDIPEDAVVTIDAIYAHVNNWLRGCGFYPETD